MEVFAFFVGAAFAVCVMLIISYKRKIKELENKIEDKQQKERENSRAYATIAITKAKLVGLKFIIILIEMFDWRGRYRRRAFIWRFAILLITWSCINHGLLGNAYMEYYPLTMTRADYSARVFFSMCIWLVLLGPCISRRLHDAGQSAIILLLWWILMIPLKLVVDWGQFEYLVKIILILTILSIGYWLPISFCWDSKENNKWGVSPKYPNGKICSKFMLK